MKKIDWQRFLTVMVCLIGLLGATFSPAGASARNQADCPENLVWREQTVGSFVIIYTPNNVNLAQEFINNFRDQLDQEFQSYAVLFGTELETPITVRIYPSQTEYYCLNALAPLINAEDTHSHIGSREVALIGEAIRRNPNLWFTNAVNAMRHEFAVLYAEKLSDGNAPPGLLQGLGGYFENPSETFERRFAEAGGIQDAERSLQRLLEEDVPASNAKVLLQQTSFIAYLIDTYGWDQFIAMLGAIRELPGYRQAFTDVYLLNIQEVQAEWENYFPVYVTGRWQANIVHAYDLDQYEVLIAGGAYQDALEGLQDAAPIVRLFAGEEKIARMETLLHWANQGVLAGKLALDARQLILVGDYAGSIEKAEQAISIYNQLNDNRRISELETYYNMAFEIITLRTELEDLKGFDTPLDPQKTQRILAIGRRLGELGDAEGVRQVQLTLILLSSGQRNFIAWTTVIGLLGCVFLIYRRFRDLYREKPPEVNLL